MVLAIFNWFISSRADESELSAEESLLAELALSELEAAELVELSSAKVEELAELNILA